MKHRLKFGAAIALAALVGVGTAIGQTGGAGQVVYVKVASAEVKAGPGISDKVIAKASQGTALTIIEKSGWKYKVRMADGKTGYVVAQQMATEKPRGKTGLTGLVQDTTKGRESSTSGAVAGMTNQIDDSLGQMVGHTQAAKSDFESLVHLADTITDQDIAKFQADGKIGENTP